MDSLAGVDLDHDGKLDLLVQVRVLEFLADFQGHFPEAEEENVVQWYKGDYKTLGMSNNTTFLI